MDDRTVGSYGIRKDGDTAFLYLLSAKDANLSEQRYREDRDGWVVLQPVSLPLTDNSDGRRKCSTLPSPLPKKGKSIGRLSPRRAGVHLCLLPAWS